MNQALALEAASIALDELKTARQKFNDDTTDGARLKLANACIRLAQCMTRDVDGNSATPTPDTPDE